MCKQNAVFGKYVSVPADTHLAEGLALKSG
jgi:hypothetical protein